MSNSKSYVPHLTHLLQALCAASCIFTEIRYEKPKSPSLKAYSQFLIKRQTNAMSYFKYSVLHLTYSLDNLNITEFPNVKVDSLRIARVSLKP